MTTERPKKRLVLRKKEKKKTPTDEELRLAIDELKKDLDKEQPFQFAFNWGGFYDSSDPEENAAEAAEDLT